MKPSAYAPGLGKSVIAEGGDDVQLRIDGLEALVGELVKAIASASDDLQAIRDIVSPKPIRPWLTNRGDVRGVSR